MPEVLFLALRVYRRIKESFGKLCIQYGRSNPLSKPIIPVGIVYHILYKNQVLPCVLCGGQCHRDVLEKPFVCKVYEVFDNGILSCII